LSNGLEYCHVDYIALQKTCYSGYGEVIETPIDYEGLPTVGFDINVDGLRAAVLDDQQNGLDHRDFTKCAIGADAQGYIAILRGNRVPHWGRGEDQHLQLFTGANPHEA